LMSEATRRVDVNFTIFSFGRNDLFRCCCDTAAADSVVAAAAVRKAEGLFQIIQRFRRLSRRVTSAQLEREVAR
ncbi:hypothetical protein QUS49_22490, partial [Xanthomonas citri pv. citri]